MRDREGKGKGTVAQASPGQISVRSVTGLDGLGLVDAKSGRSGRVVVESERVSWVARTIAFDIVNQVSSFYVP